MMDQGQVSEALSPSTSLTVKKLNAEAPEFVPRSSASSAAASPPPVPQLLLPAPYARPASFAPPLLQPYYGGYENYSLQKGIPFYGYNVSPVGHREVSVDGNNGGAAVSSRNGLPDAQQKIINQVEFYFSDINLATTDQLFRYMSKDAEGYVPISVVASFKKIKAVIGDSSELASILRRSNKLVISEDGKMVKRQKTLTELDMEELQSRIVVAENLPEDHSHQNLMKIFASVGSVKSIRTCPPQNWNGVSSASRTGKGDGLNLSGKLHAFVEYESAEVAERAVAALNDDGTWRSGLKVRLLLKSAVKSTRSRTKKVALEGQIPVKKDDPAEIRGFRENISEGPLQQSDAPSNGFQVAALNDDGTWRSGLKVRLLLKSAVKSTHTRTKKVALECQIPVKKDELAEIRGFRENISEGPLQQSDAPSNGFQFEDIPKNNSQKKGRNSVMGGSKTIERGRARGRHHPSQNGGSILGAPPLEVVVCPEKLSPGKTSPVPRMPDGTKGFSIGRGKPLAIKTA